VSESHALQAAARARFVSKAQPLPQMGHSISRTIAFQAGQRPAAGAETPNARLKVPIRRSVTLARPVRDRPPLALRMP
jgi:hypothetical protein